MAKRCDGENYFSGIAKAATLLTFLLPLAIGCKSVDLGWVPIPGLNLSLTANESPAEAPTEELPAAEPQLAGPLSPDSLSPEDEHHDFAEHLVQARSDALGGNEPTAVKTLERLVDEYPERYEPYHHLAVLADSDHRHGEAAILYRQAASLHQGDPEVFHDLGVFLLEQGEFDAAEAALIEAVNLAPDKPGYRSELAILYAYQERYEEALSQWQYFETEADSLYLLSFVLADRNDMEGVRDCLLSAVEANPTHEEALSGLQSLTQCRYPSTEYREPPMFTDDGVQPIPTGIPADSAPYSSQPASYYDEPSDRQSHIYRATAPTHWSPPTNAYPVQSTWSRDSAYEGRHGHTNTVWRDD